MTTLAVLSEASGANVGSIARAPDGTIKTDGLGKDILAQIMHGKGWTEQETFDALADGGWSNGYVSVRA